MKKIILVAAILIAGEHYCLKSYAYNESTPDTTMKFVDKCTGEEVGTTTPNGVQLVVDIYNVDKTKPLWLDLKFGPPDQADGTDKFKTFRLKRIYYPDDGNLLRHMRFKARPLERMVDKDGHFQLKQKVSVVIPKDRLLKDPIHRVWRANLLWTQSGGSREGVGKAGSAEATIYLLESENERFYRSTGHSICLWQTPVQIQSDYRYNDDIDDLHLTTTTKWSETRGHRSRTAAGLLPNQNFGGVNGGSQNYMSNPLTGNGRVIGFGGVSVWFFKYWRHLEYLKGSTSITRGWTVGTGQGGFFGNRYHFDRIPVEEYVLKKGGPLQCSRWAVERKGYLDVGRSETEFYVVPASMAPHLEKSSEFIEKLSPTVNTCRPFGLKTGAAEFRIPDGGDGMQFFYPIEEEVNQK